MCCLAARRMLAEPTANIHHMDRQNFLGEAPRWGRSPSHSVRPCVRPSVRAWLYGSVASWLRPAPPNRNHSPRPTHRGHRARPEGSSSPRAKVKNLDIRDLKADPSGRGSPRRLLLRACGSSMAALAPKSGPVCQGHRAHQHVDRPDPSAGPARMGLCWLLLLPPHHLPQLMHSCLL